VKRFALALTVILLSTSISAQLVQQASKEDLIEKLTPPASPASPASRSLRNLVPKPVNVDLSIHFDFDSARLQAQSKPLLDNLALAMNSARLSPLKFKVEGHTDAKGSTEYNQALSARRASAVQAYLIGQNVQAERLEAEGKGASELLIPEKPMASENRRVRISLRP
jgi:outer membrane protein OmpA-like peptidoglycan-associated protein